MRETHAVLVPTRTIIDELLTTGGAPGYVMNKLHGIADRHGNAIALARERGVTIASGTDIATSGAGQPDSWGRNGREPVLLADAGLTPLEAITAATAHGPLTLGPQAPRSGRLSAGYGRRHPHPRRRPHHQHRRARRPFPHHGSMEDRHKSQGLAEVPHGSLLTPGGWTWRSQPSCRPHAVQAGPSARADSSAGRWWCRGRGSMPLAPAEPGASGWCAYFRPGSAGPRSATWATTPANRLAVRRQVVLVEELRDELTAAAYADLGENRLQVILHGVGGNVQLSGDHGR